ncbi:hypothetical protein [Micromonospora sp. NPDC005172]|uniref:hypothetical protein n=1 Tax=Micromonospora sp. NPDC005172 TaxID=3156867 RepID=UPI0033BFB346
MAEKMASASVNNLGDIDNYLEEFMRWPDYIKNEFRRSRPVSHRALLLTLAVLGKQSPGFITSAQQELLTALGVQSKPEVSIGQPDIEGRLAELEVKLIDGFAFLDRARPGLSRTILRHVWINYWDLHDKLLDWMAGLPARFENGSGIAPQVAVAVVALAIDVKDPSIIESVAKNADLDSRQRELATEVLTLAVRDAEVGQFTRELLLKWSRSKSVGNQKSVLQVCNSSFGVDYPGYALTRLRWLLLGDDTSVTEGAEKSLRRLAAEIRPDDLVMQTAVSWIKQSGAVRRAGKMAFVALVTPESRYAPHLDGLVRKAVSLNAGHNALKVGWRAILRDSSHRHKATIVIQQWTAAIAAGELEEESAYAFLFDVLCEVAIEDLSILEALIDPVNPGSDSFGALQFRQLRRQVLRAVFGRRKLEPVPFQAAVGAAAHPSASEDREAL